MIERPADLGFFENVFRFPSIGSTQDYAREMVAALEREELELPPTAVVAREQLRGRGRLGRTWSSPTGGLYLTLTIPVDASDGEMAHMSLLAAVVLAEVLRQELDLAAEIKWPNDVLVRGKKVAGTLVELVPGSDARRPVLLVGLGINVSRDALAGSSLESAGVLEDLGERRITPDALLDLLLVRFGREATRRPPRAEVIGRWLALTVHRPGDPLRLRRGDSQTWTDGRFAGLDDLGRLKLEVNGQVELVSAGDVELVRA